MNFAARRTLKFKIDLLYGVLDHSHSQTTKWNSNKRPKPNSLKGFESQGLTGFERSAFKVISYEVAVQTADYSLTNVSSGIEIFSRLD